jgi:hypothetical protein
MPVIEQIVQNVDVAVGATAEKELQDKVALEFERVEMWTCSEGSFTDVSLDTILTRPEKVTSEDIMEVVYLSFELVKRNRVLWQAIESFAVVQWPSWHISTKPGPPVCTWTMRYFCTYSKW